MKLVLDIECIECRTKFNAKTNRKLTCSFKCKRKRRTRQSCAYFRRNRERKLISQKLSYQKNKDKHVGKVYLSWKKYLSYLLGKYESRKRLNINEVLRLLDKQKYSCALSGIPFELKRGSIYLPSIDRKQAGGEYIIENIQLVCKCLNKWRNNTPLKDFISVCKKVAEFNV